jgi:transposase
VYLPPYSPDYNPIKESFSKFKHLLHWNGTSLWDIMNTENDTMVENHLCDTYCMITSQHAIGWFRDCGYPVD